MKRARSTAQDDRPFTACEVLTLENIPASTSPPADFTAMAEREHFVLSSSQPDFDPRRAFTRLEGPMALWEARFDEGAMIGRPLEEIVRLEAGSVKGDAPDVLEPFRPLWHPYVYHPKMMAVSSERPSLRRKSGTKVRPAIVYNADNRVTFLPQGYPWQCIGRILIRVRNDPTVRISTGTLVGKRTVLTCAHSFPWGLPAEDIRMQFVPAYYKGTSTLGPGITSWVTNVGGYPNGRQGWDVMVGRLDQPLGETLGTLGTRLYDSSWEDMAVWTAVGYPDEINVTWGPTGLKSKKLNGEQPAFQGGIAIEDDDSDGDALELEHKADMSEGNSGGPLLAHFPKDPLHREGPYIVGVQVGWEEIQLFGYPIENNNLAAGGKAMLQVVNWGRNNWG